MNTVAWHQKLYMYKGKVDYWVKTFKKIGLKAYYSTCTKEA